MDKKKKRKAVKNARPEIFEGSGNVFADLGYANPEEALVRSSLAQHIAKLIEAKNLTQVEAASILGIDQPKVSKITKGQIRDFSTERLLRFIVLLGQDVEIVIKTRTLLKKKKELRIPFGLGKELAGAQ